MAFGDRHSFQIFKAIEDFGARMVASSERQADALETTAAANGATAGSADTPHVSYGLGSGAAITLSDTDWHTLQLAGNVESTVTAGSPVATLEADNRIQDASGRTFLLRLDCQATATPPPEEDDAAALSALGIVGGLLGTLTGAGGLGIAKRKRHMSYAACMPVLQVGLDIGGAVGLIIVDQIPIGWGAENRLLYSIPAFAGLTWQENGAELKVRVMPCPSHAESGVPTVIFTPTSLTTFNIESFSMAATGSA